MERVASAAKLADEPSFFRRRQFSIIAAIKSLVAPKRENAAVSTRNLIDAAAGIVQQNLAVKPVAGSRLVDLSYSDPNPARSQRIASAYADAFIASNLDKRFEANAYAKTFLEDQIKQLKAGEYEQEARTWAAMKDHIYVLADALASGIAKQFPDKFR